MEIQLYSSLDRKIFLVSSFYTGIRKNKHTDKKTPALIGLHWLGSSCELIQNNQFPIIYYRRCYSHLIGQCPVNYCSQQATCIPFTRSKVSNSSYIISRFVPSLHCSTPWNNPWNEQSIHSPPALFPTRCDLWISSHSGTSAGSSRGNPTRGSCVAMERACTKL